VSKIKGDTIRLSFLVKVEKKGHRYTERIFWHYFVSCFSNVWRKCCLSVLECSHISLGFSWLNASLSVEIKQLHFSSAQKEKHQSELKFRMYICNASAALLMLRHRTAKQLLSNVYVKKQAYLW